MKYLLFLLILMMWGCATPEQIIQSTIDNVIRVDTVKVTLPQETVFDTVYINNGQGESIKYIVRTDSVRVYVKGKERIIYVPVVDTVTITRTEIKTVESDDFFRGVNFMTILYTLIGIGAFALLYPIWTRIFGK